MSVRFVIDAPDLAHANARIDNKMTDLGGGRPYEVSTMSVTPAATPVGEQVGPPWRFTVECVFR